MDEFAAQFARFLSVNTIAFTAFGYPMSYIELFGTVLNLWSVWLVARNRVLTWPVGIGGVALFLALFYQIRLYADTFEQAFYLVASFYGWWSWSSDNAGHGDRALPIRFSAQSTVVTTVVVTLVLTGLLGYITGQLHIWLPSLFPEPASYPYLDALTTVMSFSATLLMAWRRIECWIYWILVDIIGIALYFAKDVRFIPLLYVVFLVLAISGLLSWLGKRRQEVRFATA